MPIKRTLGHIIQPNPVDETRIYAATNAAWVFTCRHHLIPDILDQGQLPECVGYGHHTAAAMPPWPADPAKLITPHEIYLLARELDPISAPEGASVRGGMEALKKLGIIDDYVWLRDLQSIIEGVRDNGPVVAGTPWTDKMMTPDDNGYVSMDPNEPLGNMGHCYTFAGVDQKRGFTFAQSWGYDFGLNGRALQSFDTVQMLLDRGGVYALPKKKVPTS